MSGLKIKVLETGTYTVQEDIVKVVEVYDFATLGDVIRTSLATKAASLLVSTAASTWTEVDNSAAVDGQVLTFNSALPKKMGFAAQASGAVLLTNRSGSAVAAGDVVIIDSANASSFKTTTTQQDPLVIGVVSATIANGDAGMVTVGNTTTVKVTGNVAIGAQLITSTSAKYAMQNTGSQTGVFGIALSAYVGGATGTVTVLLFPEMLLPRVTVIPSLFERDTRITGGASTSATTRRTLVVTPALSTIAVNIAGALRTIPASTSLDLDTAGNWDSATYATAANRAGKDFYLYACENSGASAPLLILSANATAPSSGTTPRKIGGFHCLCVNVGTIANHTLTGYIVGDILPQSVWDLKWKPKNITPEGMVYSPSANIWVDIYLLNSSYTSTYATGAGALVSTNWMNFVDGVGSVGKRLLRDFEFQLIASGGNEQTNIAGSAWVASRGGHVNTASRRMISNIGCEDCAGLIWQWLDEQSYWYAAPSEGWFTTEGSKGQMYLQSSRGDVKLLAGFYWGGGAACGSRARNTFNFRWGADASIGARAGVEPG